MKCYTAEISLEAVSHKKLMLQEGLLLEREGYLDQSQPRTNYFD